MRILIAEDDIVSSKLLRRALEKMGHEVTSVTNGAEAWSCFCDLEFPLVISDWMMPEVDGPELCRRIRARNSGSYSYLILITSKDSQEDRLEAIAWGADDFLVKPIDYPELVARLSVAQRIIAMQDQVRSHSNDMERLEIGRAHV